MKRKNIEIKAKCTNFDKVREILTRQHADFRGIDSQVDTYFRTRNGSLKLREASLPFEKGLIFYKRTRANGPKISEITVYQTTEDSVLKEILIESLEVLLVIKKRRELFTIDNVKFHLDTVSKLGTFLEIEAQDTHGLLDKPSLLRQCKYYMNLLQLQEKDLVADSYKELLLKKSNT